MYETLIVNSIRWNIESNLCIKSVLPKMDVMNDRCYWLQDCWCRWPHPRNVPEKSILIFVYPLVHVVLFGIQFVYFLSTKIFQLEISYIKTLYLFHRGWKLMSWIHLQSNILEYIILNYRSLTPSHEPELQLKKYQEIQMVDMSLSYRLTFLLQYSECTWHFENL